MEGTKSKGRKMLRKGLVLSTLLAFSMTAAMALETSVKPTVTQLNHKNPKSGLIVGNSYSYYNCGIHSYLRAFTREDKRDWKARLATISAGKLSFHDVKQYMSPHEMDPYASVDANGMLKEPMFEVVFLQGQSFEPIRKKDFPTFQKYLRQHVADVKAAGSEPIVVMTWAKQDKPEETKLLADATTTEANANGAIVLPVGLAFAESLKKRPDLILHQKDKSHPTSAGSYLYSAMMYGLLFGDPTKDFKARGECEKPISPEDAVFLRQVAWDVLNEYYGWKK